MNSELTDQIVEFSQKVQDQEIICEEAYSRDVKRESEVRDLINKIIERNNEI